MTPRAELVRERLMSALRESPGGVIGTDVRRMMHECGYLSTSALESVLAMLPDNFPVWEELDEDGDVWYHLQTINDQPRRKIIMPEKKKPAPKTKPDQVLVDPTVMRLLRHYIADHGGSLKDTVEKAVRQFVGVV